ncbi:polyhydroxyalkanoate synthesis repressor PhaR [Bradyrhizobium japonicum]|nr:polyhydroxyalkanoate synthesis repressor PhaR [Bradyrhizobium japonicum]MCP1942633.1 polyhydroxyalkanoate synthesis repressor PhaR [Bradyrhizobium japonicum]
MAKSDQPTTIKKYANRRLYNTGTSTYVTLEDLAAMVKDGEDFLVYDAKTGDDITRSVLAQIIFEQENKAGQNLLPTTFLRQLIRFYGDSMQMVVPKYLEQSIAIADPGAGEVPQADREHALRHSFCAVGRAGSPQHGAVPADLLDVQAVRPQRGPSGDQPRTGARRKRRGADGQQQHRRSASADEGHAGAPRADVEEGRVGISFAPARPPAAGARAAGS